MKSEQDPSIGTQVPMEVPLGTWVDCANRGPLFPDPPLVGNITENRLFDDFQMGSMAKEMGPRQQRRLQ